MKTSFQVSTGDYEYILQETDTPMSAEEAVSAFLELRHVYSNRVRSKLTKKEWNDCLDKYLQDEGMSEECMSKMNEVQKWMIHELDKAFSRINNRNKE